MTGNWELCFVQEGIPTIFNRDISYEPSEDGNPLLSTQFSDREQSDMGSVLNHTDVIGAAWDIQMEENQHVHSYRKASPYEWLDVLDHLHVLAPNQWLSQQVICRVLMDIWWPLRYSQQTTIIYLPFQEIHELSTKICKGGGECVTTNTGFQDGCFFKQYSTVVLPSHNRAVCFVLIRNLSSMRADTPGWPNTMDNANHFFTVVFNYDLQMAYTFGALPGDESTTDLRGVKESNWNRWYGPQLWMAIAHLLGWEDSLASFDKVSFISKEWQQVLVHHCFHLDD